MARGVAFTGPAQPRPQQQRSQRPAGARLHEAICTHPRQGLTLTAEGARAEALQGPPFLLSAALLSVRGRGGGKRDVLPGAETGTGTVISFDGVWGVGTGTPRSGL